MALRTSTFRGEDGLRLVADVGGPQDGLTVVLMHGGGQTRHSWDRTVDALAAAEIGVINLDARGHGESDWAASGDYSPAAHARDLASVLRGVTGPIVLAGASMGGLAALHYAGATGDARLAALALVDVVPRPEPEGAERIRAFMLAHQDGFATLEEAVTAVAAYNPRTAARQDPLGLAKNLRRRGDGRLYWHWDPRLMAMATGRRPAPYTEETLELSGRVDLPTLLIRGALSDVVSDEGVAELKARLQRLEVCEVGGAGHMVAGDRNDAFTAALLGFVRRFQPDHELAAGGTTAGGETSTKTA